MSFDGTMDSAVASTVSGAATVPESMVPWAGLIVGVKNGDQGAAQRLVECLYPKIIRIVRNHVPSSVEDQDLMQDVFLKMFAKIEQFRGPQPFDHWVARIAVNTCYDRLRQHKSRRVFSYGDFTEDEAAYFDQTLASETQEVTATQREGGSELLERLLATLNAGEQMVIRMLDLEEKSVAAISELTGWGASRIKVTAFRARRKLTATLQRLEEEGAAALG
jgi:RNA polymerase sigma factor (sigma-70 family)